MIPGVPYDAEIEYLESDGTQYINTGIVPTIDTSCVLDYMDVTFVGWGVILGSATSDNNADSWYLRGNGNSSQPGFSFRIDGKSADQQILVQLGTRVLCIASKDSFSVDDVTKTIGATAYSSTPTFPMYLFACNLNGSPWRGRLCKGRVYSCKIYQGSVLVRHYIPVSVGTEGCLYDRVTRRIFRNAGTGAFVRGPDVARPVLGLHRFAQVKS